jgi:hypothetical protein
VAPSRRAGRARAAAAGCRPARPLRRRRRGQGHDSGRGDPQRPRAGRLAPDRRRDRRVARRRAGEQRALRRHPARGGARRARRAGGGGRRGARRRHRPRPRPGAPLGLAAAREDGRPAVLPALPRHGAARWGRPEVLALPGRPGDPAPVVAGAAGGARPPGRRTSRRGTARRALAPHLLGAGRRRERPRHRGAPGQRLARPRGGRAAAAGQRAPPPLTALPRTDPARQGLVRPRGAGRLRCARAVRGPAAAPRLGQRGTKAQ